MKANLKYYFSTALVLLLICGISGGIVAAVHALTASVIDENEAKAVENAILRIFPEAESFEREELVPKDAAVKQLYRLKREGETAGFAAIAVTRGFKDEISLCIGVSPSGSLVGVYVIENSETPGVGTRVCEEEYLSDYIGLSGQVRFGEGIDAVSGATVSSRAILKIVNIVLNEVSSPEGEESNPTEEPAAGEEQNPETTGVESAPVTVPAAVERGGQTA